MQSKLDKPTIYSILSEGVCWVYNFEFLHLFFPAMKEGSLDFSEEDSPGNLLGRNPIMSDFTLGKLFSPSASLSILYEITFARQTSSTLKIDGDGCKQHFLKI